MAILPGRRLGPYEIPPANCAGGMGEVYRARDTRLDRMVAIKVLPVHFADTFELRERFEYKARTIANRAFETSENGSPTIHEPAIPWQEGDAGHLHWVEMAARLSAMGLPRL